MKMAETRMRLLAACTCLEVAAIAIAACAAEEAEESESCMWE